MKNKIYYLLVLILLCCFSCEKEESTEFMQSDYLTPLVGGWEFIDGPENYTYLLIGDDYLYHRLESYAFGIRKINEGVVSITKDQLIINSNTDNYTSIYNYSLADDTLTISNSGTTYKLLLDESAPAVEEWVKEASSTFSLPAPIDDDTDITFDGSFLWYGNAYSSDYIYAINPNNGAKDSVKITQHAWAIENDGTDLWVSSNGSGKIYRISKTDGSLVSTSIDMGAWIYGIAKDDIFLWCYSDNENILYKYNSSSNTVVFTIKIPSEIRIYGLTFVDGYLYVTTGEGLHKCSLNPFRVETTYTLNNYSVRGVTHDGTSFWVSVRDPGTSEIKILKLSGVN